MTDRLVTEPTEMERFLKDFIKDFDGQGVAVDILAKMNEAVQKSKQLEEANERLRVQNKALRYDVDALKQRNNRLYAKSQGRKREIKRLNNRLYIHSLERKAKSTEEKAMEVYEKGAEKYGEALQELAQ